MNVINAPLYTSLICKALELNTTEELKSAQFYINDKDWALYTIDDSEWTCRVDDGYKIKLIAIDDSGAWARTYYQEDFLSLLESGHIIPYKDGTTHINHVVEYEPFVDGLFIVHEGNVLSN